MARKTASDFFDKETSEPVVTENVTENEKKLEPEKSVDSEVKDIDSEHDEKDTETGSSVNSSVVSPEPQAQSQEEYMKQYQQYMQQYQQYYSQYYNQYHTNNSAPVASDPAYEYFTGASAGTTAPPAASFDASRASRQMSAYFDPTKFQAVLSPEMLVAQRAQKEQQQSKLTAKEIEAFKKKKIEKKKAKNRWLFE